jgi:hypothetical protein
MRVEGEQELWAVFEKFPRRSFFPLARSRLRVHLLLARLRHLLAILRHLAGAAVGGLASFSSFPTFGVPRRKTEYSAQLRGGWQCSWKDFPRRQSWRRDFTATPFFAGARNDRLRRMRSVTAAACDNRPQRPFPSPLCHTRPVQTDPARHPVGRAKTCRASPGAYEMTELRCRYPYQMCRPNWQAATCPVESQKSTTSHSTLLLSCFDYLDAQ